MRRRRYSCQYLHGRLRPKIPCRECLKAFSSVFIINFFCFCFGGVRGYSLRGSCTRAGAVMRRRRGQMDCRCRQKRWKSATIIWVARTYDREGVLHCSTRQSKCVTVATLQAQSCRNHAATLLPAFNTYIHIDGLPLNLVLPSVLSPSLTNNPWSPCRRLD